MREVGWNQLMKNRLALGLAGAYWGGRSVGAVEPHCLSVADFPAVSAHELDDYVVPTSETMEGKPKFPPTWDDWLRRARRGINAFALIYGEAHRGRLSTCLDELERMQEENPTMLPRPVVHDIWEELHWRFSKN